MAPVKRSTTTAQRETRATRAATVAKKKATTADKNLDSALSSKPAPASTRSTTSTRQSKKPTEEQPEQAHLRDTQGQTTNEDEVAKPTRARATRSVAPPIGLAAAPRRRVKVTPLDAPQTDKSVSKKTAIQTKSKSKDSAVKKTSARSKKLEAEEVDVNMKDAAAEPKTKSTRKTTLKTTDDTGTKKPSAPKTKGQPKTQKSEEKQQSEGVEAEPTVTTRATRSNRAASVISLETPVATTELKPSKPQNAVRKKVTFQDLPSENDKENQPLPEARGKKVAAKKDSEGTKAITGLRAKPLRKAVASTTRGRKAASTVSRSTSKVLAQDNSEKEEKRMPRALTPKRITQVARSSSPEQNETETSEDEDELNGGKTPIRDLSMSPRRPTNAALVRALSPAKKLDFCQSLVPKSPDRTAVFRDTGMGQSGILASPARRPAASPFKDGLKDSPRRGLQESVKSLFPIQSESIAPVVLNPSALGSNQSSTMFQSPKRTGILDSSFFSQSAMKKSAKKSPFKSSLFGTPAKRLFSPTKKSTTPLQKVVEAEIIPEAADDQEEMEIESEITASSHFRSSSSPLRVMRVELDTSDMDFDDSVLQFRSPLKVPKSPMEVASQPDSSAAIECATPNTRIDEMETTPSVELVNPLTLDVALDCSPETTVHNQNEESESLPVTDADDMVEGEQNSVSDDQIEAVTVSADAPRRQSLSQLLFRSTNTTSEEESSEDELAGDKTPMRQQPQNQASVPGTQVHSRTSVSIPPSTAGKGFGFTPLAAQMSGWLASSPEKSPVERQTARHQSAEFSPVARQHIDGEVVISRDSTPVQKLNKRVSVQPLSARTVLSARKSADLRRSVIQRQSLGLFSGVESPARNQEFEEYMEIRAVEEQAEAEAESASDQLEIDIGGQDFDYIMDVDRQLDDTEAGDDTVLESTNENGEDEVSRSVGDLTTDLINFTHASDTAMVDFQKLAEEADQLATKESEGDVSEPEPAGVIASVQGHGASPEDGASIVFDGFAAFESDSGAGESSPVAQDTTADAIFSAEITHQAQSPLLLPVKSCLDSPSVLVIDQMDSPAVSLSSPASISVQRSPQQMLLQTPQPNLRINERRVINTVISKVPLKPEGLISPIKMSKKRSRSFGNSDASPAKRASFENLRNLQSDNTTNMSQSPDRRVRTSVAPSPGGTSTPATAKFSVSRRDRMSLSGKSVLSTPGSMSFAVDDFGDSTLDGIELPESLDELTEFSGEESPARSLCSAACTSAATTPKSAFTTTPVTSRRSVRRVTTPATVTKTTPKRTQKTPKQAAVSTNAERTPLGPVGKGVLHGATVFVDVHTSEGADASGIFIELLTQMGAKCVKDWRWNPRASLAPDADELSEPKIGITHVVYKDGGKRTLEKVRDAKGEVCCVGVSWVLDCERENKWLDESTYAVDTSIIPRGGSKRRKSMEPRALLVANDGSVSASRARRSVSAEMSEHMKRELVNTPARGPSPLVNNQDEEDENDENVEQATPTGFVSYDPRTAMTPGTPYLISQGKKLAQMSAPPKQQNKSLFEDEDEENDDIFTGGDDGDFGAVKDAKKFRMKSLGDIAKRRRTLGWKPSVGSPLGRI